MNHSINVVSTLFVQEVDSREHHVHQLQAECDDIKHEKNQLSIASSDMEREINRLKKVRHRLMHRHLLPVHVHGPVA